MPEVTVLSRPASRLAAGNGVLKAAEKRFRTVSFGGAIC
jgi:hypothetical protein